MNITITSENANELDTFVPVSGTWAIDEETTDGLDASDVEESVRNWMDAEYKLDVRVFSSDGGEITGDLPFQGSFLATRV